MTLDKIKCTGLELDTAQEVTGFFYAENGYVMYGDKPDLNQPCVRYYIVDEDGYHREVGSETVDLILEQQMSDKQESAMNISERDIEDAFIQHEDAAVERELVESDEWVNGRPNVGDEFISNTNQDLVMTCSYSSKYVVIGQIPTHQIPNGEVMDVVFNMFSKIKYEFSKPLTPEQLAANGRLEAAYDLYVAFKESAGVTGFCSFDEWHDSHPIDSWLAIVDKTGYRK